MCILVVRDTENKAFKKQTFHKEMSVFLYRYDKALFKFTKMCDRTFLIISIPPIQKYTKLVKIYSIL